MRAHSPAIRSGPALAVAMALAFAAPAGASDATQHHFSIYGSLTAASTTTGQNGSSMQMQSRLSPPSMMSVEQAGGGLVMNARLAQQPLGCAGDTIFANGFDP
ncbi:MAG TPA: hypothetical protein VFV97_17135 [Rhodanobacteraceae bacterium]|nr:hypothetical protein [Rhodanobacteraceae bacterium]